MELLSVQLLKKGSKISSLFSRANTNIVMIYANTTIQHLTHLIDALCKIYFIMYCVWHYDGKQSLLTMLCLSSTLASILFNTDNFLSKETRNKGKHNIRIRVFSNLAMRNADKKAWTVFNTRAYMLTRKLEPYSTPAHIILISTFRTLN